MFAIESSKVQQAPGGWIPVRVTSSTASEYGTIDCMSLGFLLKDRGDSVVWRGPKKTAMIRQFTTDVLWGELDYLLIDTPPGTGDEHISLAEQMHKVNSAGAIIVTTPQAIATSDVRKEMNFCKTVGLKILGVVENMSGFICPHCAECTNIFSSGGGLAMAQQFGVEFFGAVPIDPAFGRLLDEQGAEASLVERYGSSSLCPIFAAITESVKTAVRSNHANGDQSTKEDEQV